MSQYVSHDSPELLVEIDFTNDPTNASRVWTDVTDDVRQISYTRSGRNHELQRTDPGTLSALLNNRHGDYDSTNTGSPHYPGVKRKRWIRVSAVWASVTYRRWTGLIESWQQNWPAFGKDATVEIRAADALTVLNLFDLDGLSFGAQTTGARVTAVLTAAGIDAISVDTGATTIVAAGPFTEGSMALSHLLEVEQSENGLLFAEGDGSIVFQARHYRLQNSTTPLDTIGDAGAEIPYRAAILNLDDGDLWNSVTVTPDGGTAEVATNTASITSHYERRLNRSILSSSQSEALSAAQYLVARYADPDPRIPAVELVGASASAKWPTILGAGNSDRFTWTRRATAHTITQDVFVERVSDTVTPGHDWRVSFQFSPSSDQAGWVLDTSHLDTETRLVY